MGLGCGFAYPGDRKGRLFMVRKDIGRTLSGIAVLTAMLLTLAPTVHAQFGGGMVTFSISGNTGVGEVELRGFPSGSVRSDATGYYQVEVRYGWSGTVTLVKEGYSFTPSPKSFSPVKSNLSGQDFVPELRNYTISGTTGMGNIRLDGFPEGSIQVGPDGRFEASVQYGWSGTITPMKEGIAFSPPYRSFNEVKRTMTQQNFTAQPQTYTISGTMRVDNGVLAGVVLQGFPEKVTSKPDGSYSVQVPYKWNGTIIPLKDGYVFEPGQMEYHETLMDQLDQDYYGNRLTYVLTGSLGIDNATLQGFNDTEVSYGAGGYFEARVNWGSNVVLTPKLDGYDFNPPNRRLTQVRENMQGLDFEAKEIRFTLSGTTGGLADVELQGLYTLDGQPVYSDQAGSYSVTVPFGWSGVITPVKEGYSFTPENRNYDRLTRDMMSDIYRPAKKKYAISGTIPDMEGVLLRGFPVPLKTTRGGVYSTQVEHGWSGTVTPERAGYEFDPPSIEFTDLKAPQTNQDFIANIKHYTITGTVRDQHGPVEGALVQSQLGGQVRSMTDYEGRYELRVPHNWSGPLGAVKEGYDFLSSRRQVPSVMRDMTMDFVGKAKTFKIIGEVIISGEPIEGVTITATNTNGESATTDSRGRYTVEVPYNWTGEIIPTKEGFNFNPPSKLFSNVDRDIDQTQPEPTGPAPGTQPVVEDPVSPTEPVRDPSTTQTESEGEAQTDPNGTLTGGAENGQMQDMMKEIKRLTEQLEDNAKEARNRSLAAEAGRGPIVDLNYEGDPLQMVLSDLSVETDIPIMADQGVTAIVTCNFPGIPLEDALDIALAGTGYVWKKTEYGGYLVMVPNVQEGAFPLEAETRRVKLRYMTGASAQALMSPALRKYVQAENDKSHVVTITAAGSLMKKIVEDLKTFDTKPSTVLLTTRIVSLTKSNLLNLGIEWGWPTIYAGGGFTGDAGVSGGNSGPWGVQIGYSSDDGFTNALTMGLNMLRENGQAQIIAEPKIFATDGKSATFAVINQEYFMLTPDTGDVDNYYAYSRAQMEDIETGTKLDILPNIGDNNEIYLQIAVELSDTVAYADETGLPVVTRRTYNSEVVVQDGGTVAVAGLSKTNRVTAKQTVPGLSKLPLIGGLFKNNSDTGDQYDVAIFVTAELVRDQQRMRTSPRNSVSPVADPVAGTLGGQMMPNTSMTPSQPNMMQPSGSFNNPMNSGAGAASGGTGNFNQELYNSLYGNRR